MFPTTRSPILAAALALAATGCFESSSAPGSGGTGGDGGDRTVGGGDRDGGSFAPPEEGGAPRDDGSVILDPGGDAYCEFELEHDGCDADARIWRQYDPDPGFAPTTERVVEGSWQGAEDVLGEPDAQALRIDAAGTSETVRVWADVTPLEAVLAIGDAVRLSVREGVLTLHRSEDGALVLAVVRVRTEPLGAFSADGLDGLGASLEATEPCDDIITFSTYCPPNPARGYDLAVGTTVVPLSETLDVTTGTGTFRVTNVTMYGASHYRTNPECAACAIGVEPEVRVHAVRVE